MKKRLIIGLSVTLIILVSIVVIFFLTYRNASAVHEQQIKLSYFLVPRETLAQAISKAEDAAKIEQDAFSRLVRGVPISDMSLLLFAKNDSAISFTGVVELTLPDSSNKYTYRIDYMPSRTTSIYVFDCGRALFWEDPQLTSKGYRWKSLKYN